MADGSVYPTVVNKKTHKPTAKDVYIGRPTVLGNPYTSKILGNTLAVHQCATAEESVNKYGHWLKAQIDADNRQVMDALLAIPPDANLVCWCHPNPCHGDMIIKALKMLEKQGLWPQKETKT